VDSWSISQTQKHKKASYTSAHITETVFAHDQHWDEQSTILTTAVSPFARAQKMDNHTVAHHTTSISTCPTLRGAKHFPSTSYFFLILGVYTVSTHFYYTKAKLMRRKYRNNSRRTTAFRLHRTGVLNN